MAGLGQALGAMARGADLGLGIAERVKRLQRTDEDQAFQDEARDRQRQDWGRADEEQKRIASLRKLTAAGQAIKSGGPVDPSIEGSDEWKDTLRAVNPRFEQAKGTAISLLRGEIGRDDPAVLEAGDVLFSKEFSSRVGRTIESDTTLPDGTKVPKGAKIVSAQSAGFYPMKGKDGKHDSFAIDMRLGFQVPGSSEILYGNAPATENGDSSDKAKVSAVSIRGFIERIGDLDRLAEEAKTPAKIAILKQKIALAGGDPNVLDKANYDDEKVQAELDKVRAQAYQALMQGNAATKNAESNARRADAAMVSARRPVGAGGGSGRDVRTALQKNAEYVAQVLFKGDEAQAVNFLNTAKNNPQAATLSALRLAEAERKTLSSRQQKEFNTKARAAELAQMIMSSSVPEPEPAAALPPQQEQVQDFSSLWGD